MRKSPRIDTKRLKPHAISGTRSRGSGCTQEKRTLKPWYTLSHLRFVGGSSLWEPPCFRWCLQKAKKKYYNYTRHPDFKTRTSVCYGNQIIFFVVDFRLFLSNYEYIHTNYINKFPSFSADCRRLLNKSQRVPTKLVLGSSLPQPLSFTSPSSRRSIVPQNVLH